MIESEIENPEVTLKDADVVVETPETEARLTAAKEVTDITEVEHAVILQMAKPVEPKAETTEEDADAEKEVLQAMAA